MQQYNPWPKDIVLKILVSAWCVPIFLISILFTLFLMLFRQIANKGWKDGAWELLVTKDSWLNKKFNNKWGAFSLGFSVIYNNEYEYNNLNTRYHERIHLKQQLVLGLFQWIFYGLFCIIVFIGCDLHAYRSNPFEIDARLKTGQELGNLKADKNGDRWPWW
jgi:hypothetical protein